MKIIVKVDFVANGKKYLAGEELKNLTFDQIIKLNEQGFIQPLTYKDLVLIERELEKKEEL